MTVPDQDADGPPSTSAELRRARRDFVRASHPDRGGDPAAFADGLARFDALLSPTRPGGPGQGQAPTGPQPRVTVLHRPRGLTGWARHLSRLLTAAAGRGHGRAPRVR